MLFQRTNGLYTSVGGFGPLGNKVFLEECRLAVAEKVLRGQNRRKDRYTRIQLHAHQAVDHRAGDKLMPVNATVNNQSAGDDPAY